MTAANLTDCVVYLDAGFDLYQAGDPHFADFAAKGYESGADVRDAYCADFTQAFEIAAEKLGRHLGVSIRVEEPPCSQYGGLADNAVESEEWARDAEVWQGLHECIYWNDVVDEWMPNANKVYALAKRIIAGL